MSRPQRTTPYAFSRGSNLSHKTCTYVPADVPMRPLRDVIIVEPLDGTMSSIIDVIHECRPVRGIVKAVGPGVYPIVYLDAEGHRLPDHARNKRKQKAHGKHLVPTSVKVGDVVELGGLNVNGYNFDSFQWGDKLHLICREADIAAVHES